MNNIINNILDTVYPPVCGFCGKLCKDYICKKCIIKIKQYEIKKKNNYTNKNMYFDEIYSIFRYEGTIRDLIIKYKFQNKPYLYKTFSKIILKDEKACSFLKKYDIIIPVPIYKKRKQQRGYNQTELISKEISKNLNIKIEKDVLTKNINTKAQSRLSKKDRKHNIKNAFKVKNLQKIENKNILIFDDIYTTGSTTNECAKVLKEAAIKKVGVLTIAKDYKKVDKEAKDGRFSREYTGLC